MSEVVPWNRCRSVRCLTSQMQIAPFFPAEIRHCCSSAYATATHPYKKQHKKLILATPSIFHFAPCRSLTCSCEVKLAMFAFFKGIKVSQSATFLDSPLVPPVAIKLELPRKTKSLVCLEWHWMVWNIKNYIKRALSPLWILCEYSHNTVGDWLQSATSSGVHHLRHHKQIINSAQDSII